MAEGVRRAAGTASRKACRWRPLGGLWLSDCLDDARSRVWSLAAPSKVPVRGANALCHGRGAWRPGLSLAGRGVGGRELQGPVALGYLVGVVLWSLGVGGETGLVGFAGEVVVYHGEHVVVGTVNHCYAYVELAEVHGAAMVLRVTGKEHQRGSR